MIKLKFIFKTILYEVFHEEKLKMKFSFSIPHLITF